MDYAYDGLDRLTSATYSSLGGDPAEAFNYDLLGNRGGNAPGGDVGYTDARPGGASIEYAENNPANEYAEVNSTGVEYDAAGNLTADEDGFFMAYDAESQLAAIYADSNGNGDYDSGIDDLVAEYKYDALGRRIEFINRYDGSGIYTCSPPPCAVTSITRYVYDRQNVVAEYNDASVRQRYYVQGTSYIDERALMRDETETPSKDYYYLLKDLYTVVGLVTKQGHEVERYTYDAYGKPTIVSVLTGDVSFDGAVNATDRSVIVSNWGLDVCSAGAVYDISGDGAINATDRSIAVSQWTLADTIPGANLNQVIPASAVGNPYGFTGRALDVFKDAIAGLPGIKSIYHYRARYYNSEHGRFLQNDPAEYHDGLNLYEYVRNAPTNANDPTGLISGGSSEKQDRTKACCKYTRTYSASAARVETSWTRRFQKTERCPPNVSRPEECCNCPPRRRTNRISSIDTVDSAVWGKCCWCRVNYSRATGPWWSHAVISMRCANGKRLVADHALDRQGIYLWINEKVKGQRGSGFPPSDFPVFVETLRIDCDTGQALIDWARPMEQNKCLSYGWIHDCHWFAREAMKIARSGYLGLEVLEETEDLP